MAFETFADVDRNLRLYIVLIGAAIGTGLFGANWRSTADNEAGSTGKEDRSTAALEIEQVVLYM